ncbi:MAG: RNA-directed DNA polymerase [Planctomycetaceae bacterium]|nr:RNA-directed DNA polymerase [Planctomycetaceae bacterium]
MGLFNWLRCWFLGKRPPATNDVVSDQGAAPQRRKRRRKHSRARLVPLRAAAARDARRRFPGLTTAERTGAAPYRFARPCVLGGWLDFSLDGQTEQLGSAGLPVFETPQGLADWLELPLGRLAWLIHRFEIEQQPPDQAKAHYHFCWLPKRRGGKRLIESPKPILKRIQHRILREILDKVPLHPAAHGFAAKRSIRTNAAPHVGQRVILKMDLENFYPSVRFSRVVAIFRSLGYSREAALWLSRLTTSSLPANAAQWSLWSPELEAYLCRHLPQGAPTSPALANLSAFSLDLRLAGLARTFGARYTRYADDLTFSGDEHFSRSLAVFIPLAEQIIRAERFRTNKSKRHVVRDHQRQQVTGVVVNRHPNVARPDYDRLKAVLTNCIRRGPSTQNHSREDDYAAHLRGCIAHVAFLNPSRGEKLLDLFSQIDWNR